MFSWVPSSQRVWVPEPILQMHPDTAKQRHIADGEWAALCTPAGSIRLRAKLDEHLHPEVVAGEDGWWQGCVELDLPEYDPLSSPMRGQPCDVRKLGS